MPFHPARREQAASRSFGQTCFTRSKTSDAILDTITQQSTFEPGRTPWRPHREAQADTPSHDKNLGSREASFLYCSAKLHNPGKPAFHRLGILPQQLRTSPFVRAVATLKPLNRDHIEM